MNEELIKAVEDIGLSQKEARVYLSNLALGPATVQQIADHSGIKRVTSYVILESLVNLGLASQTSQGKKTYFNAEDPSSLHRLLDKKEQVVKEQKQHFEEILPEIEAISQLPHDTPTVKFYDGVEGIRAIVDDYNRSLKRGDIGYGITNIDRIFEYFPEFKERGANPDRVRKGVPSKLIYTSQQGPILRATDEINNRQSRYFPPDKFPFSSDWNIIGDNLVILSLVGARPVGVTIHSKEVSVSMMSIFNLAWEGAAKYNK